MVVSLSLDPTYIAGKPNILMGLMGFTVSLGLTLTYIAICTCRQPYTQFRAHLPSNFCCAFSSFHSPFSCAIKKRY